MFSEYYPKDEASKRLAHPFRAAAFSDKAREELRKYAGEAEWARFVKLLRDESLIAADIVSAIQDQGLQYMKRLVMASTMTGDSTELGGVMPMLVSMRHVEMPYPIFRVDDTLVDILTKTDISDDISISMLPLPFPRLFVELGQSRTLSETVSNVASGQHILEGAYIEKGMHERFGEGYYVMLTGSPIGKEDAMDDATVAMFLPVTADNQRLEDVLKDCVASANAGARSQGLKETPVEWTEECFRCLLLLIKALLYISLPDARRELHPERTSAQKDATRLKNPAKRQKAERRANKLSDYVVIKAAIAHEKTFSQGTREGGVAPHWRRAHYRMQAHGPQMSLRKLIFITETLVGAGDQGDSTPAVHNYEVR